VVAITAGIQATVLRSSGRLEGGDPVPIDVMFANLGTRAAGLVHLKMSEDAGFLVGCALAAIALCWLVALAFGRAWSAVVCMAASLLVFAALMAAMRGAPGALMAGGDRYFSLPVILWLWAAALGLRAYPRTAGAAVAVAVWLGAPTFHVAPLADLQWTRASACLATPGPCRIPINPEGWTIDVPGR
jgi:hypothetical protein